MTYSLKDQGAEEVIARLQDCDGYTRNSGVDLDDSRDDDKEKDTPELQKQLSESGKALFLAALNASVDNVRESEEQQEEEQEEEEEEDWEMYVEAEEEGPYVDPFGYEDFNKPGYPYNDPDGTPIELDRTDPDGDETGGGAAKSKKDCVIS